MLLSAVRLKKLNLSFSGSGFMLVYQLGVAKCLLENGKALLKQVNKFAGTSGGSLVAAMLMVSPDKLTMMFDITNQIAQEARQKPMGLLTPGYRFFDSLETLIQEILPVDAYRVAKNKLHVSLTCMKPFSNLLITDFNSREELVQCLKCSCFIPVFCGTELPVFRQKICLDGGYTCNLPRFENERTVGVTPFSGEQDICPFDPGTYPTIFFKRQNFLVNAKNAQRLKRTLFPPPHSEMLKQYEHGYNDAASFLKLNNWYKT